MFGLAGEGYIAGVAAMTEQEWIGADVPGPMLR